MEEEKSAEIEKQQILDWTLIQFVEKITFCWSRIEPLFYSPIASPAHALTLRFLSTLSSLASV